MNGTQKRYSDFLILTRVLSWVRRCEAVAVAVACGSLPLSALLSRDEREAYMAVRGVAGSADYDFWYEIRLSEGRAHFHMGLLHSYDESLDSRFFSLIQYLRRNFLTNTLE